ncbi:MAG TPA: hypothetical protein VN253_15160 [Kofleriaceae bacterium]|nr:hypothetical protein [Kofleriaceae bacterium]
MIHVHDHDNGQGWDPCADGGLCGDHGPENTNPGEPAGGGAGGGGGGGKGGKPSKPPRPPKGGDDDDSDWMYPPEGRDCSKIPEKQACLACCQENLDNTWYPHCDKFAAKPQPTKDDLAKKEKCKKRMAEVYLVQCMTPCFQKPDSGKCYGTNCQ